MEIYVSTDIETDGPIPGPNSMLSFGSAAFNEGGDLVATFEANLHTLEGATGNPETMAWWATQPEAWAACREGLREPESAMTDYVAWLKSLPGKPVFVGYPAGFDFLFVYWYLIRFTGSSPFSFSALDIKELRYGGPWDPVQEYDEEEHAEGVVHRSSAYSQGARRRPRPRRAVHERLKGSPGTARHLDELGVVPWRPTTGCFSR